MNNKHCSQTDTDPTLLYIIKTDRLEFFPSNSNLTLFSMSSVWTGLSADPERRLRLKQKESDLSMEDSSADFNFYTT